VDTELFRPATRPTRDYIVSVGRFSDPRKNVELLLNAYAMLQTRVASAPELWLVGDAPTQPGKDLIGSLGIAGKVKLLGPKRGEELADIYRNAKFFALSSWEEGLAIVILEAMASGLPVVSTDCGGPSTAVKQGETGFLTPVGDAPSMASAMEQLLKDAEVCERMGLAGRRAAEERFSLQAAGKVFLDKYDELLGVEKSRGNGNGRA
jgi:glycosyltransferase involved in cell wall biosynthesis